MSPPRQRPGPGGGKQAKQPTEQQRLGRLGEDRALSHLVEQGLALVERNFLCKVGEIDLIMRHNGGLVFVEVRRRAAAGFGGAAASVTPAKRRRLINAAQYYLLRYPSPPPCRFDLVAIDDEILSWIQNILEL
ncbi:putative endonuclease [Duganella sp. 1411]|uniref:YraN family protein n=1 Tax=Duganella sp. 1411 TaxID=2806572 RepID=UPI001AE185B4|nr:YraN family protein [Duganella sp. 1411]MBP1205864.1 putative endonuclease [Duganella sp. 1411]